MKKLWILALAISVSPCLALADDDTQGKPLPKPTVDAETLRQASLTPMVPAYKSKPHSSSSTAGAAADMHASTGTIVSFSGDHKTVTINYQAFADGFEGAGEASFAVINPHHAKKFKAGDSVEFTLAKVGASYVVWSMSRAGK